MATRDNQVFHVEFTSKQAEEITEYVIPEGYKVLGVNIFQGFRKLEKVVLPSTLVEIRTGAFDGCTALKKLEIPQGVKIVKAYAFSNCSSLEELILPESIITLGLDAFKGCSSLKRLVIPSKIRELGYASFSGCKSLQEVILPKNLTFIDNNVFTNCVNLKRATIPSKVTKLGYAMFSGCKSLESVVLPKGLKKISVAAFDGCTRLDNITIPKGVKEIETAAFQGCTLLENIVLPKGLKVLSDRVFSDCSLLKDVAIPKGVKEIGGYAFSNCYSLENIVLPERVAIIGDYAFTGCDKLESVNIPKKVTRIERATFLNCSALKEIDISNVRTIGDEAFKGCSSLGKIVIPEGLLTVGRDCFSGCNFNYVYREKGSKNLVFSQDLPQDMIFDKVVSIDKIQKHILDFDISQLAYESKIDEILPLVEKLSKAKLTIPNVYFQAFQQEGKLDVLKEKNFKFLGAELNDLRVRLVTQPNAFESLAFMKFANLLGCFSNEKILDKDGRETQALVAQKASSLFASIVKNDVIISGRYSRYFESIPLDAKPNQDLLKFLSLKSENKSFTNLELLMRLEDEHRGIFAKVITRFDEVKEFRTLLDDEGKPYNVSWEQAIRKFNEVNNYENVNESNRDIAKLFTKKGFSQDVFDKAVKLRQEAVRENVPSHILGKPLREETIIEKIERVRKQTDKNIIDAGQLLDELYEQKFTYEMLDKHDAMNPIIGLYCSCCATITSGHYGKAIAEATMVKNDVQNLVVRDARGDIVAKGTMYVNRQKGYAVINDFELNEKYRSHEQESGWYSVGPEHKDEQERELIFQTFKRGINAFVKEYDAQHPEKPIKKVTVGTGYNRLKRQCERYKEDTDYLRVPAEYNFLDAQEIQRVLYARGVADKDLMVSDEQGGGKE